MTKRQALLSNQRPRRQQPLLEGDLLQALLFPPAALLHPVARLPAQPAVAPAVAAAAAVVAAAVAVVVVACVVITRTHAGNAGCGPPV